MTSPAAVAVVVVEAEDRDHGTLFTGIAAGDPTGDAVGRKHYGKK